MGKSFRLFEVTMEIAQGEFHLGSKSKDGYTKNRLTQGQLMTPRG